MQAYQEVRAIEVLKIQSAARNSMEWFEMSSAIRRWKRRSFLFDVDA